MAVRVFLNEKGTHATPDDVGKLPYVDVEASVDERLVDIARKAQEEYPHEIEHARILFVSEPNALTQRTLIGPPVACIDGSDRLFWTGLYNLDHVTWGDLRRAKDEGLFAGDSEALLVERPTRGNGGLVVAFQEFIQYLRDVGEIYGGLLVLKEAYKGLRSVFTTGEPTERDVAAGAAWLADFFERHSEKFESAGADPLGFLLVLFKKESWDSRRLRQLLDLNPEEADQLLELFGYAYDPSTKVYVVIKDDRRHRLTEKVVEAVRGFDPRPWKNPYLPE